MSTNHDTEKTAIEPYFLNRAFEAAAVTAVCKFPKLFARIGREIDPRNLALEPAKLAMETAQSIARETGAGPNGLLVVLQRLNRGRDDGRIKFQRIEEVNELFDDALDMGLPDEDSVVRELAPILSRRIEAEIMQAAADGYANQGDFERMKALLARKERLGNGGAAVLTTKGTNGILAPPDTIS